jgi:hypothetical protein
LVRLSIASAASTFQNLRIVYSRYNFAARYQNGRAG